MFCCLKLSSSEYSKTQSNCMHNQLFIYISNFRKLLDQFQNKGVLSVKTFRGYSLCTVMRFTEAQFNASSSLSMQNVISFFNASLFQTKHNLQY